MYSPTARLLAVLELLQSNKRMTGPEIAQRLEIDVRTVRRYITTLQDMGIPVEGERGAAGAYQLGRGHRLPPLLYSEDEAVALALGLMALQQFHFPVDAVAVEGALAKTERVVPETVFRRIQSLRSAILFNASFYMPQPPALISNQFVVTLTSAVQNRQSVQMRYQSWQGDFTQRMIDPYALVYNEGYWYAVGYCHLRQDIRVFRLDRIQDLQPLSNPFEQVRDLDPLDYVLNSIALSPHGFEVELVLFASMNAARSAFSIIEGVLEETNEGVIFRRNIADLDWLAYLLLQVPFRVQINSPLALKHKMREIAARAKEMSHEQHEPVNLYLDGHKTCCQYTAGFVRHSEAGR